MCSGCPNQARLFAPRYQADYNLHYFYHIRLNVHLPDYARHTFRRRYGYDCDPTTTGKIKHKSLFSREKAEWGRAPLLHSCFRTVCRGMDVGLLDVDICGPSVPVLFGKEGHEVHRSNSGWSPVYVSDNLAVMWWDSQ